MVVSNNSQNSKIENSKECTITNRSTGSEIKFSEKCVIKNSQNSVIKFSNNCKMVNCNNCTIEFSENHTLSNKNNVHIKNNNDMRSEAYITSPRRRRDIVRERTNVIRENLRGGIEPSDVVTTVRKKIGVSSVCKDDLKKTCIVCSDCIKMGETKTILKCLHHYHKKCIEKWSKIGDSCPECRFPF